MGPIYKGIDFADLFDVIGAKGDQYDITWKFVSCKHAGSNGGQVHLDQLRAFKDKYGYSQKEFRPIAVMSFERWTWHKPKWCGRGKKKHWEAAHWQVDVV